MADGSGPEGDARPRVRRSSVRAVAGGAAVVLAVLAGLVWMRAGGSSSSGSAVPRFVDETVSSGIAHRYEGDFPFYVGGGVAAFDCSGDGRPELYVAGGSAPAALYLNRSPVGGALQFERISSPVTDLTAVTGAYPIDLDSDGVLDLVVLRNGSGNQILRGLGGCRFEAANDRFGLDAGAAWTVAFSATWEAGNELPTLAFGNYLVPDTYDCDASTLVRPAAKDHYGSPVRLSPGYCALSALFSDWSRSGRADLRLANDRHYYRDGTEQLWRVGGGQPPRLYTAADGWRSLQIWGMGIASQDLTGDGYPEVYLTSQGDNKLQTLDRPGQQPAYHDMALKAGATAQRPYTGGDVLPSTAWHAQFADVNDDGRFDLFVSKGNVDAQLDNARKDPSDLLLGRADGTFREVAPEAGVVSFERARGAAVVDLNLDGLPDLVVVNRVTNVKLWRNVGRGTEQQPAAMGHWLQLRLRQPAPNVDAIGAWVDVRAGGRTVSSELTIGGGHASGQLGWFHLGIGEARRAEIRIHWPGGATSNWMGVDADQFLVVDRDAPAPQPWRPAP